MPVLAEEVTFPWGTCPWPAEGLAGSKRLLRAGLAAFTITWNPLILVQSVPGGGLNCCSCLGMGMFWELKWGQTPSPCQTFVLGLSMELFGGCLGPPELPSPGAPAVDAGGLPGWLFLRLQRKFPASSGSGRCPSILPPRLELRVWQSLACFLTINLSSEEEPPLQLLLSCPEGIFQAENSSLTSLWTNLLQVTEFNFFRSSEGSKGSQRHPERQFCWINLFL